MDVLGRTDEREQANAPRLEFRKRGSIEQPPRTYAELVADAQLELEREAATVTQRRAEARWGISPKDWPPERPRRDGAGAEARRAQLEPSWQRMRERIDAELTDFVVHCWIKPCELVDSAGDVLFVAAPGHARGWVRERYGDLFRHAARELAGRELRVVFVAPYADSPCYFAGSAAA